jgi:L-threonylcarbamoyladenylate synthase
LPRTHVIPDAVTAGRPLVGVRIPAHEVARTLLRAAAVPVAAPSANRFGHTSPTTAAHVLADLDTRIDAVLDAGPTSVGLESTVLDPATMTLYRPGAVTADQITAVTGLPVTLFVPPTTHTAPESLPSPGVGIRHYAPNARLVLTEPTPAALYAEIAHQDPTGLALLHPTDWPTPPPTALLAPWAPWSSPEALATTLFAALRHLDDLGARTILAPLPPPGGLHDALRDRLQKAARPA